MPWADKQQAHELERATSPFMLHECVLDTRSGNYREWCFLRMTMRRKQPIYGRYTQDQWQVVDRFYMYCNN